MAGCTMRRQQHTFAYFSLRLGVPVDDVSREMGHESVATTYQVYGGWCRVMGARAARLREEWARGDAWHGQVHR
jgi:integrase